MGADAGAEKGDAWTKDGVGADAGAEKGDAWRKRRAPIPASPASSPPNGALPLKEAAAGDGALPSTNACGATTCASERRMPIEAGASASAPGWIISTWRRARLGGGWKRREGWTRGRRARGALSPTPLSPLASFTLAGSLSAGAGAAAGFLAAA